MSAIYNITIEQGATYELQMIVSSSTGVYDLSGQSARGQVRKDYNSPKLVDFVISSSFANDGKIGIQLSATQTAALPAGNAKYDIELVNGSTVTRLVEGSVTIKPEVTK